MIGTVKRALSAGYYQHTVAGYFLTNQGRISEIKNEKWGCEVPPAEYLPPDFPPLNA
jgi:hypothetical protein